MKTFSLIFLILFCFIPPSEAVVDIREKTEVKETKTSKERKGIFKKSKSSKKKFKQKRKKRFKWSNLFKWKKNKSKKVKRSKETTEKKTDIFALIGGIASLLGGIIWLVSIAIGGGLIGTGIVINLLGLGTVMGIIGLVRIKLSPETREGKFFAWLGIAGGIAFVLFLMIFLSSYS